jgi:hypothetical protein
MARGDSTFMFKISTLKSLLIISFWGVFFCSCGNKNVDELIEKTWYFDRIEFTEESQYFSFTKLIEQEKAKFGEETVPLESIGSIRFEKDQTFVWNVHGLETKGNWQLQKDQIEIKVTESQGTFLSGNYSLDTFEHYVLPSGISLSNDQVEFIFFLRKKEGEKWNKLQVPDFKLF